MVNVNRLGKTRNERSEVKTRYREGRKQDKKKDIAERKRNKRKWKTN